MRILVIYTGGVPTFADQTTADLTKTLQNFLELQLVADLDIAVLHNLPGADINYELCTVLSQRIYDNYDAYDGFVVIHGLDNVLYTANLFTFLFSSLGKPVIFTGCTLPDELYALPDQLTAAERATYRSMGLRTNLVTAVQLAILNCSGTLLAYSPHIVRAVRAIEATNEELPYLRSWLEPNIAEVQFGIRLAETTPQRQTIQPQLLNAFSTAVYITEPRPNMTLPPDVAQRYQAVIIKGYREELFPSQWTLPTDIPVIIQVHRQEIPQLPDNVITVRATWPVIVTKTMAVLGQTQSLAEFKEAFQHNRFGEFN